MRVDIPLNDIQLQSLRNPLAGEIRGVADVNRQVREAELYRQTDGGAVDCFACGHECHIKRGGRGVCQVRFNVDGKLYAPHGYVAALQCDPTEKKPFYHIFPGSDTLTFGMLGCDLHCSYCQNWDISQALRDANAGRPPQQVTADELVAMAGRNGATCVASSYNEPLITSEWAMAVFQRAKADGFTTMYISNGNATREVLEYIRPHTDGYKIDLKTMNDKAYRKLGAVLQTVLDSMAMVHEMGFWMEIVTLVIPGYNDDEAELREAARYIKSLSPDIPWHVTGFHTDYKMQDHNDTEARQLIRAAEIGYEEGLNYVYAGNRAGQVGRFENTFCPNCHATLIERFAYVITGYHITAEGTCPHCDTAIAGLFPSDTDVVRLGVQADVYRRRPKRVR